MAFIQVHGLTELKRALQAVSKEAPKELGKTNQKVGQIVVAEAIRRAPKGLHEGGGTVMPLARTIKASRTQNRVRITAGGRRTPYAAAYEFGGEIPRRGHKGIGRREKKVRALLGGRGLTHIKAQSYLIPAIIAKRDEVINAYRKMLDVLAQRFREA